VSKDPFEELFGPAAEEPMPQTRPMPARQRLAQEQEVRVRASQPAAAARSDRAGRAKPWIVVGIIAVLAIVASITVVNLARGGGQDPASSTAGPSTSEPAPQTTAPPTTDPEEETPTEEPEEDKVPKVEVGPTMSLPITQLGVTSQLSGKFGSTLYRIENNNTEIHLDSALISQLPCEGNWGAVRTESGKFEVLKPAERCAAAPELYDELWGLTDAWVKTIK